MPRRLRGLKKKGPKAKKVAFELIDPNQKTKPEAYKLLTEVRKEYHSDTLEARVALAWHKDVKADADGHLVLGRCHKVSDLHKEFMDYDFVIELNREVWFSQEFTADKKKALLDHEMCHIGEAQDKNGEPKVDERGRKCFRMVRHDIEEFHSVIRHHGVYKSDLQKFAEEIVKKQGTLFPPKQEAAVPAAAVN